MPGGFERGSALDKVKTAVTIADPALPDVPIIYANQAFEDLTGYGRGQVVGQNCRFLQGEDTDPSTVSKIRQAIDERRDFEACLVNYTNAGARFDNLLILSHFEAEPRKRLILGCQFQIDPNMTGLNFHVRSIEEILQGIAVDRDRA